MSLLLQTKICLPPLHTQHASRQRLIQKLTAHGDCRLILVSAPAGFGKSSCLIEWANAVQQNGKKLVWYALDEQDNDPVRFAAYLINAFLRVDKSFETLLHSDHPVDLQDAITLILNVVAQRDEQYCLILDDYHLITTPHIHDALARVCEYMPQNMQMAIGTRADPPLQLARLRARGEIIEIRMADLRFRPEELRQWLKSSMGWTPSEPMIQQLGTVSDGWAAALSLIIIGARKHSIGPNEQALESQLTRYSQTQRHIFDYFAQEVLEAQPSTIRQFLLDTCVLNRLHPHLCSVLTNDCAAPLLLNQIATESLFVIPLSTDEPIYRYHHLFADFLRQQLQLQDEPLYLEKHRLAAEWFAHHDDVVEAIHHALEAQDFDFAATLIEDVAWEPLTSRSELVTIINWLPRFSEEVLRRCPRLCLYFSRALYLIGKTEPSEKYLHIAAETLRQQTDDVYERPALQAIVWNYQATLAAYQGDVTTGLVLNAQAFRLRQHVDALDRVRIANTDAYLHFLRGDVPSAREAYTEALDQAMRLDHQYLMLDAHSYLARIDLMAGQLQTAKIRGESVLAQYDTQIAPLSAILLPLAHARYEQNQVLEAEMLLRDAVLLAQRGRIPDVLWNAYTLLAGLLMARGAFAEAHACLQQARKTALGFRSPVIVSLIEAAQARMALQSRSIEDAVAWAQHYCQAPPTDYQRDYEDLTLARVWLAQGLAEQALEALSRLLVVAQISGRMATAIETQLLRGLAYQAVGKLDAPLDMLGDALRWAKPEGFVRLFLDEGAPMLALLRHAVAHCVVPEYALILLDIAEGADRTQHPADALTVREIEVLRQMAAGASNRNIAASLVISLGTVKSHIHHIMNKLDAQNRTEAVNKARSLNLLKD